MFNNAIQVLIDTPTASEKQNTNKKKKRLPRLILMTNLFISLIFASGNLHLQEILD